MKKSLSLILALVMLIGLLPQMTLAVRAEETAVLSTGFEGKKVSILGDSISTYTNVSNNTSYNSTIGSNKVYYSAGTQGVYQEDTWWQQTLDALGMELCVNNSWSGSAIFGTRAGTVGAYLDRCVQLHNDKTGEEPDIIFVFLGTNDFSYTYEGGELGSYDLGLNDEIDFSTLIQENEDGSFTYGDPTTSPEAYAIMLHKMQQHYPNAEIYCMSLMTRRYPVYSKTDVGQPTEFNAKLKEVVDELGAYYIELEGLFSSDPDDFDLYMGDKRVHPNIAGMDLMTEAVVSALLGEQAEIGKVSYALTGVMSSNTAATVLIGGSYTATLSTADTYSNIAVTVTMGGEDVTASCYKDGEITISKVTGDIAITASVEKAPANYRWELDGGAFVSKGDDANALTLLAGSVSDGVQNSTRYALAENVVLKHDQPWVVEWKASGDWSGMLLTSTTKSATSGMEFVFRTYNTTGLLALGYYTGNQYNNYGIPLADLKLDMEQSHTYRMENRIAEDGSNMVYLLINGVEIGALNNYYIGGTKDQNVTVDWVSGQDFIFGYIGSTSHPLKDLKLEYLAVTECVHSYKNGVCTACGVAHPNLFNYDGKVISILGDSISTFAGYIPRADGFNLEHYARYPQDNLLTDVSETWWMQVLTQLDAKLGVNESWRSTEVYNYIDAEVNSTYDGTKACMASNTRIQNLGSNGTPDVILFYGGTNDITQRRPVGSFDPTIAPTEVDLTSVKWNTVADAYVDAIMRMQYYYPDTEIIAMLPTFTSKNTDAVIEQYNSVFAAICEHYGVTYVDLHYCGISTAHMPDGTHPNAEGMEFISNAVVDVLLSECDVDPGKNVVHTITHNLTGAESSLSYYQGVSHGKPFVTEITGENLTITVTMNGVDITDTVLENSVVTIPEVTGDVFITAAGREKNIYQDYLQQLPDDLCCSVNLWDVLTHQNTYYKGSSWGNSSGNAVYSVTIPITAGDQIWATSFQARHANGNTSSSSNAIRVTWFDEDGVLVSLSPVETYSEFVANGYITAPEGAVAVNIPMWNNSDYNEIYILNRDHCYENGVCLGCGVEQPGPVITRKPEDAEAALGEELCITVEAKGEGLKYQWYLRNVGSDTFTKSSITDNTYDVTMTTARAGREVYCVITDANGNSVTTDTVRLIRVASEKLEIITQPVSAEAALGEEISVFVEAKGEGLKYQWYIRNAGSTSFSKSSTKTNTYTVEMTKSRANRELYCVITDALGNTVTSDTVKLIRVASEELEVITQPVSAKAALGEELVISVEAKGEGLKYQWYLRNAGSDTFSKSSITDNTYDVTMTKARADREVYCVITDALGNQVTTDTVKLIRVPTEELAIITQPISAEAAMGEELTVFVEAKGEGLKYQWYIRNAGSDTFSKSSTKTSIYTVEMTKARANRELYCVITDALGNQTVTEVVTLVLKED